MIGLWAGFALAAVTVPAAPADPQTVAARMDEVKRACAAGEVERGVEILAALFTETGDYTAIYNQARCYQKNHRPEQAIARFRQWLSGAPDVEAGDRRTVEGYIQELQTEMASQAPAVPRPPVAPVVNASGGPTVAVGAMPQIASTNGATHSLSLKTASIALGAAGLAAAGAGFFFGHKMKIIESDINQQIARQMADPSSPGFIDASISAQIREAKKYESRQFAAYGIGAAAVTTGTICYFLGRRTGQTDAAPGNQFGVLIVAATRETGAVLWARF